MNLPAIPKPGTTDVTLDQMIQIEKAYALEISASNNIDELAEARIRADAMAHWLRRKELHAPMLGVQRRIEARIGQLLGTPENGGRGKTVTSELQLISPMDRARFRRVARAMTLPLTEDDWRQTRQQFIGFLHRQYPVPKQQPSTIIDRNGRTHKARDLRAAEIRVYAGKGYRAAQIAREIGIGEHRVRDIANAEGISLPDAILGRVHTVKARRVIEATVHGLAGSAAALEVIKGVTFNDVTQQEAHEWALSLCESITTLKRLMRQLKERANHGNE